ncbi:hypothetical protein YPC_1213 [Yersinia pestis biovar Medievalis str. Harbin 35]|nr:hypothetical protein YPC_1213 [Yersinia pestis biovar Medievalis str. Harbin 35]EEO75315.1 hypothetical protein YP516_3217 [Yersinia pestis Nepal516]EEO81608.1 hypothetical protein YPF_1570 [Yersinia pestis biovar Orientalis str. India 195]EEO87509.1 hypothetical protein YPH_3465 [Yersinia pestis biovar Orientalis str. PEXU2]EEO90932.1 hypothetical protein YPS_1797 [Yersinia pestis Pestoides A]
MCYEINISWPDNSTLTDNYLYRHNFSGTPY